VTVSGISGSSATITWTTDQPSTSQIGFGTTTAYGLQSTFSNTLVTAHSVTFTVLNPQTTYDFVMWSVNSSGIQATSPNYTFTTTTGSGGNNGPPSTIAPTGNTCSGWGYSNSSSCNWTPSAPSVGNTIHCFVFNFSTTTAIGLTDSSGNTFAQNGSTYHGTGSDGYYALFDAMSVTGASATRITANLTGSANFFGLSCFETSGGVKSVDGPVGTGSASSGTVSATITPVGTSDFASCGISSSSAITPGSGFTAISPVPYSPTTSAYKPLGASGGQLATATIAGGADIICGTYK
jgi:hypothetical protein